MDQKVELLFADALQLPRELRARLVNRLVDTLDESEEVSEEIETAWGEEVDRRIQEVRGGSVPTIPWEQARAHIFREGDNSDELPSRSRR